VSESPLVNIIVTQCQKKDEAAFNKWYNDVHIPMIIRGKGVKSVVRYQVAGNDPQKSAFVAVYKFDSKQDMELNEKSADTMAAKKDFQENWGGKVEMLSRMQGELIKSW